MLEGADLVCPVFDYWGEPCGTMPLGEILDLQSRERPANQFASGVAYCYRRPGQKSDRPIWPESRSQRIERW